MNDLARAQTLARAVREASLRLERLRCEADFKTFVREAWSSIENVPYEENWALDALCDHLQAVTEGHIRRLLVNYPPRCAKTNIASILWHVWTWIRPDRTHTSGPAVKFLCGSYGDELSLQISNTCRRMITSPWFQERWGKRFSLRRDQNTKGRFENDKGGARIATSVGGSLIGIGGEIVCVDDPHNTREAESDPQRETALNFWREISTTRLNDPRLSVWVCIMQRLHVEDVAGWIIANDLEEEVTWLNIPMAYDPERHCVTGWIENGKPRYWQDPRTEAGELMWPTRFNAATLASTERSLGPYMYSGRYQQLPTPLGGGIIKSHWWQPWAPREWPVFEFILASVDTAHTEKQENDPSAMTVWGVYKDANNRSRVMLVDGWAEHLEFHDLVSKIAKTCKTLKVDRLLIEAKANGMAVAQEIRRLHSRDLWTVEEINPGNADKIARVHSIVPLFADGVITAPLDRDWAQMVIKECASFPKGKHDDLVDTCSQALRFLRSLGLAEIGAEIAAQFEDSRKYRSPKAGKMPYAA